MHLRFAEPQDHLPGAFGAQNLTQPENEIGLTHLGILQCAPGQVHFIVSTISFQQFHMWVIENLVIDCQQGTIMDTSCCHNNLISGITMKFTGKLGGFNGNLGCEIKKLNARISESRIHPLIDGAVKGEFVDFDKFGNFPA